MPRSVVVEGSPEVQRPDEEVAYNLTLPASYTSPAGAACTLYDLTDGTDVSSTKLSGSASIAGQVFTSPLVTDLVAGRSYRLEFRFTSGGNTFEPYLVIEGVA